MVSSKAACDITANKKQEIRVECIHGISVLINLMLAAMSIYGKFLIISLITSNNVTSM